MSLIFSCIGLDKISTNSHLQITSPTGLIFSNLLHLSDNEIIFKKIQALATKGWMMYYAVSITIFAGIQGTPITSLLSKCVETSEFGQVNIEMLY